MKDIQEVIQLIVQDCELILCKLPSSDLVEERIDINACCVDTIVNTFKVDRSSVNSWDLAIFVRIASAMTSILFTGIHAIQDEEEELYFQYRKDLFEHWTMFCALCFCFFSDIVPPNSSGLLMQKLESCLSALMTKAKGEQLHSNEFLSFIDSKEKLHFEIKSFYSILVCSLDVGNRYRCSSPSVAGQCVQEQRCSLCHDILHVNLTFSLVAIAITRLHRWVKREAGFPLQEQSLSPVNHLVKTPSKNTPRKSLGIRKRSPGSAILSPVNLSVNQFIDEYLEFVSKLRLKNAHLCIPGVSRRLCTCQDDRAKPTAVVDAPRSQTPARDAADDLGTEPLEEEAVYVPDEEVYTPGPSQSSRKERVRLVAEAVVSTVEEAYEDGEGEAEGFDHRRSMLLDQSEAQEMMLAVSNRLREMEQSMETRVRETAATGREALMIGPEEEEDAASLGSDTIRSSHSDESDTWKSVGSDSGEEDEESGRNPSTPSFYLVDALSPVPPAVRRDDPVPESTPSPATVWRSPHPTPTQKPLRVSIPTWESSSRESIVLSPSTPEVKIKLRRQREANELLKLVDNQVGAAQLCLLLSLSPSMVPRRRTRCGPFTSTTLVASSRAKGSCDCGRNSRVYSLANTVVCPRQELV